MRKSALFVLVGCLCVLLLAGCAAATVQPVSYTNDQLGLSLTYAGNWGLREDKLNTAILVAAPATLEDFAANLAIQVADPVENLTSLTAEQLSPGAQLTDYQLEEFDAETLFKSQPAVYMRYTHNYNGKIIRVDQYLQNYNGKFYSYTFSCEKALYADNEKALIELRDSIAYTQAPVTDGE